MAAGQAFASRGLLWKASTAVALAAAVVVAVMGADQSERGSSPYTPTKGEWLCMSLNVQQALIGGYGDTGDILVTFAYSPAKPDTITVVVQFSREAGHRGSDPRQTAYAERQVMAAVELKGWDSWVKIERSVIEI